VSSAAWVAWSTGSRSTSLPHSKRTPARTSPTRWAALTARQRCWAASISMNAMAIPAAVEPGPLVTLVRCLTVAKVRLDGLGRAQVDPVLGRVVGEGQQFCHVADDLDGGLGHLAPYSSSKERTAARAWSLSPAFQISAKAFFAPGCEDFGKRREHVCGLPGSLFTSPQKDP
jgi:hypothetical protein